MRVAIFILVGIAILALGCWQFFRGVNGLMTAWESGSWPHTEGHITESQVKSSTTHGPHGGTSYTPEISYSYLIAGQPYVGTDIVPGRLWNSNSAYQAVTRYRMGSVEEIYYQVSDPAQSVLVPGLHLVNFGRLIFGATVLFMGALFTLGGIFVAYASPDGGKTSFRFPPGSLFTRVFPWLIGVFFALIMMLLCFSRMDL